MFGSHVINNSTCDVGLMYIFALLGYIIVKHKLPTAPMILGLILGPIAGSRN